MEGDADFNEDAACAAIRKVWLKLANTFAVYVETMCDDGIPYDSIEMAKNAVQYAFLADACFWQATGTSTTPELIELIGLKKGSD